MLRVRREAEKGAPDGKEPTGSSAWTVAWDSGREGSFQGWELTGQVREWDLCPESHRREEPLQGGAGEHFPAQLLSL